MSSIMSRGSGPARVQSVPLAASSLIPAPPSSECTIVSFSVGRAAWEAFYAAITASPRMKEVFSCQ